MTHSPEDQPEAGAIGGEIDILASERAIFFSDAVVAIAITLLALALPVPHGDTNREILRSMYADRNAYIAFLISFIVVGGHWRWHHRIFKYVARFDEQLLRLNMIWLLMVVVTPFAARLLAGQGAFGVRLGFYAAIQIVANLCFVQMTRVLRQHRLLRQEPPDVRQVDARLLALAAMFAISIPIAFVTRWAVALWVAAPLVGRAVRTVQHRRHGRAGAA
jgi:uncharacterized membrane protein